MASPIRYSGALALVWTLLFPAIIFAAPSPSSSLESQIQDASRRASLDPRLVKAVIQAESNFNTDAASPKGAVGLMQMMSETAEECGIHDRTHELNHLMGACLCLRKLINRFGGNLKLALAAYNAGTSAVVKYKGIPPYRETQVYVRRVLKIYNRLKLE